MYRGCSGLPSNNWETQMQFHNTPVCVDGCSGNAGLPGQQLRDSNTLAAPSLVMVVAVKVLECQGNS